MHIDVVVGVTFPLPVPALGGPASLERACSRPTPCSRGDFAWRALVDGCPLNLEGLEEAAGDFVGGGNVGRASAPALLLRLVSGALCPDTTLVALVSLCRAVDADTTGGEKVARSVKPRQPVDVKAGGARQHCVI